MKVDLDGVERAARRLSAAVNTTLYGATEGSARRDNLHELAEARQAYDRAIGQPATVLSMARIARAAQALRDRGYAANAGDACDALTRALEEAGL